MTTDRLTLAVRLAAGIVAGDQDHNSIEDVVNATLDLLAAIEAEMAKREQDDPPAPPDPEEFKPCHGERPICGSPDCRECVEYAHDAVRPPDPAPDGDAEWLRDLASVNSIMVSRRAHAIASRIERDAETIRKHTNRIVHAMRMVRERDDQITRLTRERDGVVVVARKALRAVDDYHESIKLRDDAANRDQWSPALNRMYDALVNLRAALARRGEGGE